MRGTEVNRIDRLKVMNSIGGQLNLRVTGDPEFYPNQNSYPETLLSVCLPNHRLAIIASSRSQIQLGYCCRITGAKKYITGHKQSMSFVTDILVGLLILSVSGVCRRGGTTN